MCLLGHMAAAIARDPAKDHVMVGCTVITIHQDLGGNQPRLLMPSIDELLDIPKTSGNTEPNTEPNENYELGMPSEFCQKLKTMVAGLG